MAVRKLSSDIQCMFSASSHVASHKIAVEELVYNALDANSTSIAIRVNIEEDSIQVIDNGSGISKSDFTLLGQRYATSRSTNLSTLKAAPDKYGYRGQSLARIIEVSHSLKITSRHQNTEETWEKCFSKGKEKGVFERNQRPSKGTTIEVKGFLYNLKIKRKAIDKTNELNQIKKFLQQLSLVHSSVSISLRDDAKNEIVFKLHKNRDIYQTLASTFEISKDNLQEFKVEKQEYKVVAYVSSIDRETKEYHWIYLNGKFVKNNKLYKIINDNLTKAMKISLCNRNIKKKNYITEEQVKESNIPSYFIFITCPYYDYDISQTPKQSVLEFKNWEQITKLLNKLVKFYTGDINLKPLSKADKNIAENHTKETRDQVKKIIDKILRSNTKRCAVSQMENGIKGKIMKRKRKAANNVTKLKKTQILSPKENQENNDKSMGQVEKVVSLSKSNNVEVLKEDPQRLFQNVVKPKKVKNVIRKTKNDLNIMRNVKEKPHKSKNEMVNNDDKVTKCELKQMRKKLRLQNKKKPVRTLDPLATVFQDNVITNSTKIRCDKLASKISEIVRCKKQRKRKVFINERVQFSNIIKDNKKLSVREKINEIVIHDYMPKLPKYIPCSFDNREWQGLKKKALSSGDLLQTILNTPKTANDESKPILAIRSSSLNTSAYLPVLSPEPEQRQTYESHQHFKETKLRHYFKEPSCNANMSDYTSRNTSCNDPRRSSRFIAARSMENFLSSQHMLSIKSKQLKYRNQITRKPRGGLFSSYANQNRFDDTSYSIEFSKSTENTHTNKITDNLFLSRRASPPLGTYSVSQNINEIADKIFLSTSSSPQFETYNISQNNFIVQSSMFGSTYTVFSNTMADCNFNNNPNDIENNINYEDKNDNELEHTYVEHQSHGDLVRNVEEKLNTSDYNNRYVDSNSSNVVFISNSQNEIANNEVQSSNVQQRQENLTQVQNETMFHGEFSIPSMLCDRNNYTLHQRDHEKSQIIIDSTSRHFDNIPIETNPHNKTECFNNNNYTESPKDQTITTKIAENFNEAEANFKVKNRPRFMPKGLSPIYENCQTKNKCNFDSVNNYFEDEIYNDFVEQVQTNAEVYESRVQNIKELTTINIEKVNNRVKKDHASLIFHGESLKEAVVLGQVDEKFIAAKVKTVSADKVTTEYLVLFDQHAVDERISLERNLSDYVEEGKWKVTTLDDVILLNLSNDDVLYLHNHSEKFIQFGLEWVISDNGDITISAIPEAILGKQSRPVDIVIKAVKNLILEQINALKVQKGCVSHPKSIMDLVFSEACRYAIKFGTKLSKHTCEELLNRLSECRTPFQCAHGRPVMAVITDIKYQRRTYQTNAPKIESFLKSRQCVKAYDNLN